MVEILRVSIVRRCPRGSLGKNCAGTTGVHLGAESHKRALTEWKRNGGPRGPVAPFPVCRGGGDGDGTPAPDLPVLSEIGPGGSTAPGRPRRGGARRRP